GGIFNEGKTFLLAWTTTPWTLPSNLGLTINKNIHYYLVKIKKVNSKNTPYLNEGENYIVSQSSYENEMSKLFGVHDKIPNEVDCFNLLAGQYLDDLIGKKYIPLFPFFKDHKNAFQIFADDFVSEEEGTGIVHMAPTGVDDARILQAHDVELFYPFNENCYFDFSKVKEFLAKDLLLEEKNGLEELQGKYFRADNEVLGSKENNANDWVIEALKKNGKLFKREQIRHSYPHCWRTDCALMYRGIHTWFVEVEKIKDEMVKLNTKIHWVPDAIGHKRFANWLENAKDWAISRNRYWGAPLPVWKCTACDQIECLGSVAELQEKAWKEHKVFVMRHGEATHNVAEILASDVADESVVLTEKGKEQVRTAGQKLITEKIDLIFASPFPRTRETAEGIAKELGFD